MVDESLVQTIVKDCPDITLGVMLREYRRGSYNFLHTPHDEWERLSDDLQGAVNTEYPCSIMWTPNNPVIFNPKLSPDTIIPRHIKEKYIRCNVFCYEYLIQKRNP